MRALLLVLALSTLSTLALAAAPSKTSEIRVNTVNGYGSNGIYTRCFSTQDKTDGTNLQYVSDPVNGDYIKILTTGTYAISMTNPTGSGYEETGITLNAPPSVSLSNLADPTQRLCVAGIPTGANAGVMSCSATIAITSVPAYIRVQVDVAGSDSNMTLPANMGRFIVTKLN